MKKVKNTIAKQLLMQLHQANLAGLSPDWDDANDLPHHAAGQDSTYGHIANAIDSLGYAEARNVYTEYGDVYEAMVMVDEIDEGSARAAALADQPSDEDQYWDRTAEALITVNGGLA